MITQLVSLVRLSVFRRIAPLVTVAACLVAAALFSSGHVAASTTPDLASAVAALQTRANTQDAQIASLQSTVEHQQVTINTLQKKTAPIMLATDTDRADGAQSTEMYFTGVNVHIVDGSGYTNDNTPNGGTLTGLGNLIVGYNETRGSGMDSRGGSHNLIVGTKANYASFGGVVFGYNNTITNGGHYAVVTGGQFNTASGVQSSVSGGRNNTASNEYASVSGGKSNTASGDTSSVSGGFKNEATNFYDSVSGGGHNNAGGGQSSISGGYGNEALGSFSNVSGGELNVAKGYSSGISGGYSNSVSGSDSIVTGGAFVSEGNDYGFAAGGSYSSSSPGPGVFHSP